MIDTHNLMTMVCYLAMNVLDQWEANYLCMIWDQATKSLGKMVVAEKALHGYYRNYIVQVDLFGCLFASLNS
jgi:hypothetical protein